MNSSTEHPSEDIYVSAEELAEELEYQKVLLISLSSVADQEAAEAEIKAEIRRLENQIRGLTQSQKRPAAMSAAYNSASFYNDDPFASVPVSGNRGVTSLTSSTSDLVAFAPTGGHLLSPSKLSLPTRKRSHDERLGFAEYANKSRRTSPSLFITRSTTPSGSLGHGNFIPDDSYFDLTAYSEDESIAVELEKVRQRQKAAEDRAMLEKADADYARQLQSQMSSQNSLGMADPTSAGSSAWDYILGLQGSGSSQPAAMGPASRQFLSQGVSSGPAAGFSTTTTGHDANFAPRPEMLGGFQESESDSEIEETPIITLSEHEFQYPNSYMGMSSYNQVFNPYASMHTYPQAQKQFPGDIFSNSLGSNTGFTLPPPTSLNMQFPVTSGLSSLPMQLGAAGSIFNQNLSIGFGGLLDSSGISASDPLSRVIQQTASSMAGMPDAPVPFKMWESSDHVTDVRTKAQEIQGLLENIRPDDDIPKENREGTPEGLKYALYEHQKLALTWLKSMEEGTNKGGILADDMGLGKTISTLALILSRPSTDRARKTTLIIGPVALVRQWAREIETKIKRSHRLSTYLYHTGKKITWNTLRTYDIVLTTYGKLGAEQKRKEEWETKLKSNPDMDQSSVQTMFPLLSDSSKWYRVILDEAQFIKNKGTRAARGACELKSKTRFCLTGTPMMNGVHELYSLIHFLRIKPYNEYRKFTDDFAVLSRNPPPGSVYSRREQENAMKRLQAVLKAILLRRTKKSKIDGQPILTLPEKTEEVVHAVFNEDEQAYYTALETSTRLTFNKYLKAGTIGKNYSNILVLLLRMRQAACHPHLIMDFDEAPAEAPVADMETWAKTLLPDVIRRILSAAVPFECPVCYDPVPNPRFVIPCGHETCSECLVKITTNGQEEGIRGGIEAQNGKCPTCRGLIDLKKVIDYETFKKVHVEGAAEEVNLENDHDSDSIDDISDTDESDTESEESDEDIRNFIVPDGYESSDEDGDDGDNSDDKSKVKKEVKGSRLPTAENTVKRERNVEREAVVKAEEANAKIEAGEAEEMFKGEGDDDDGDDDFIEIKNMKRPGFGPPSDKETLRLAKSTKPEKFEKSKSKTIKKSKRDKSKNKGKVKEKDLSVRHTSLARLKKEAARSAEGRRRYMKYLRKNWVSSAKVDKCLEILRDTDQSRKTIIFSQFTTLLDLLEIPIRGEKWGYGRYDGSMTADARHNAVVKFTDDPNCKIMLVSLKAGNAGLNLVAASQVIILDPFWNPFIEMQAVDRAHRIGQQKPVTVHRILIAKTVEDRIIELQNQKRGVIEAALDENASRGIGRLGQRELIYLFNGEAGQRETASRPAMPLGLRVFDRDSSPSPSPSI